MTDSPFARIPQLDRLLKSPEAADLLARFPRERAADALRAVLDATREAIRAGHAPPDDAAHYVEEAERRLAEASRLSLRRVINATGVLLHTNLGRAVLAPDALKAVMETAGGHSTLEYDVETGERGSRQSHVEERLIRLTGAEAAAVFNNNAAAVLIALTVLAAGREVVVSRGQLVEIGGSFRIPDIIQSGGAKLVEVGTTNRTRIEDYRNAVTGETGLLLKVHPSNYRIAGFTEEAATEELVALGRETGIPVMEDLGSGALVDLSRAGLPPEPTVRESVSEGLDLVTFSGDKLLGGPQAGILVGQKRLIEPIRRHPLARAIRCDKMTLAALEATLRLYEDGREWTEIPLLRAMTLTAGELADRAKPLLAVARPPLHVDLATDESRTGGGSLPGEGIETTAATVWADGMTEAEIARRLRRGEPPIVGRVSDGKVWLDMRTVEPDDIPLIAAALEAIRADLL